MKTEQEFIDSIKTFEDAQKATGRPDCPDFSNVPEDLKKYFKAQYKAVVIAEALNDGWNPDWDNSNEWKYFSWFEMSPVSFAYYAADYRDSHSCAGSGSPLCFRARKLAIYAGEQFIEIWKDLMLK
jgi:hypothetical protein